MAWVFWNQYFRNSDLSPATLLFPPAAGCSHGEVLHGYRGSHSCVQRQVITTCMSLKQWERVYQLEIIQREKTHHIKSRDQKHRKRQNMIWCLGENKVVNGWLIFSKNHFLCVSLVISDFPPPILEAILSHEWITERRRMQKAEQSHHRFFGAHCVPSSSQILSHWILTIYVQTRIILILKKRKFK